MVPIEIFFHEGSIWRLHRAVISTISTKYIFHFICHRDKFYNQNIKSKISTEYIDDNCTGVKPKQS